MVTSTTTETMSEGTRRATVLLADDDRDIRRLLAARLRRCGFTVVEAVDGVELLARIEGAIRDGRPDAFDVVLADVAMPGLTGLDVLAALRGTSWATPVVLMTARGHEPWTEAEAQALGAHALLDKPVAFDALLGVLQRVASRARPC